MKQTVVYQDFDKLDIRVGQVIAASAPAWSEKLLEFKVDFGEEIGQRTILAGVKQWYQPAEFLNNHYIFVVNLAEKKMGAAVSQGMMLMADEQGKAIPFQLSQNILPGTIIR